MAENKNEPILISLQKFFGVGYRKSTGNEALKRGLLSLANVQNPKTGKFTTVEEKWPNRVEALYNLWVNNTSYNRKKYEDIQQLFNDMDALYYESPFISRAMNMLRDEAIQSDLNNKSITVEAKQKIKKELNAFHEKIGLESLTPSIIADIVRYGNAGIIPSIGSGNIGVEEVVQIDIRDLKQRIEFTPSQVERELQIGTSLLSTLSNLQNVQTLIKSVSNKDNYASLFKSYLFGFQIGKDALLPPWRFIHFRNLSHRGPFWPFGMPFYLHALAPYRQYDAAMTLRVAMLGAMFPIDKYDITVPPGMSPTEKQEYALKMLAQLENSGMGSVKKEGIGIGEKIITVKDLFEYAQISPSISLANIDDLELLENQVILSTGLPRNMLDPNNGSFGNSGLALLTQFRPFARSVYQVQKIYMDGITQLDKIHLIHRGFTEEEIQFTLSMPYPESQVDGEVIRSQGDLMSLANSVLDSLQQRIFGEEGGKLPVELVKNVYKKILPYDEDQIDSWFNEAEKKEEPPEVSEGSPSEEPSKSNNFGANPNIILGEAKAQEIGRRLLEKTFTNQSLHTLITETVQEQRDAHSFLEGVADNAHYLSSKSKNFDFDTKFLFKFKKDNVQRLTETNRNKKSGDALFKWEVHEETEEIRFFSKENQEEEPSGEEKE